VSHIVKAIYIVGGEDYKRRRQHSSTSSWTTAIIANVTLCLLKSII